MNTKLLLFLGGALILFAFVKPRPKSSVAYISTNDLWAVMPEKKVADSIVNKTAKEFEEYFISKRKELEKNIIQFQKDSSGMSDLIKQERIKELQELDARIRQMPKTFDAELQKKQNKLHAPIRNKMQTAINDVSQSLGYDYVLDSSFGNIIYAKNVSDNIFDNVKKSLKIE